MTWRILSEVVLGGVAFALGASFWPIVRSPSHLARVLDDRVELTKIVAFFGPELRSDATQVKPVFGSYAGNISAWHKAHLYSLAKTRNILLALAAAMLVGSYFLGPLYLAINLGIFLLLATFPLPASAINNNVNHLRAVAVSLIRWHTEDTAACAGYCSQEGLTLQKLREVLVAEL